ncbi:MAG TPA: YezD family protein [Polyangiaceae bacterium]|nr:YezD family protein [Polyangiaceae bacterium]
MTTSPAAPPPPAGQSPEGGDPVESEILRAVRSLRFGSVEVVVHEGNVVQIVRTERIRPGGPAGRKA